MNKKEETKKITKIGFMRKCANEKRFVSFEEIKGAISLDKVQARISFNWLVKHEGCKGIINEEGITWFCGPTIISTMEKPTKSIKRSDNIDMRTIIDKIVTPLSQGKKEEALKYIMENSSKLKGIDIGTVLNMVKLFQDKSSSDEAKALTLFIASM